MSSFPPDFNGAAGRDGGGLYALSAGVDVRDSAFQSNSAQHDGAGIALDCVAEICVGNSPRDACDALAANVSTSLFITNKATTGDGGAIHVSNRQLQIHTASTWFNTSSAVRGAAVFSAADGSVLVDGLAGSGARAALETITDGNNEPVQYGPGLASPPSALSWEVAPNVAHGAIVPGDNLCAGGSGCVVTMVDAYGNAPTTPTVVEISVGPDASGTISGPRFVLVAGGFSEPIADLSVHLYGKADVLPSPMTAVIVGLQFVGTSGGGAVVAANATQCGPGYGLATSDDRLWCEPCPGGTASENLSWDRCLECAAGRATEPGTVGASGCGWCDVGYGQDETGTCARCEAGTFSGTATLDSGCEPCGAGLTTNGTGADACNRALIPSQNVDLLIVIVTVVILAVAVVALIVSCVRKRDANHGAIATVLLSVRPDMAAL